MIITLNTVNQELFFDLIDLPELEFDSIMFNLISFSMNASFHRFHRFEFKF